MLCVLLKLTDSQLFDSCNKKHAVDWGNVEYGGDAGVL
jgi:hypothetical protein